MVTNILDRCLAYVGFGESIADKLSEAEHVAEVPILAICGGRY
jgi:hypothetical protein